MEISEREYLELKRRVEELEKMQAISPVSVRKGWAYAVNEMPLEKLSLKDSRSEIPEAEYNSISYDVWNYFVKLAKQIHSKCPKYKRKWDP